MTTVVRTFSSGSGTDIAPTGAYQVLMEAWGPGGGGADGAPDPGPGGGGGGGGGYCSRLAVCVSGDSLSWVAASSGSPSTIDGTLTGFGTVNMDANSGATASTDAGAAPGSATGGTTNTTGSSGSNGLSDPSEGGAGGAGANGGAGGAGGTGAGGNGTAPGGGGGGSGGTGGPGSGANGRVRLTYTIEDGSLRSRRMYIMP